MSTTLTNPLLYSTKFSSTNSLIIRLTLLIFEPTPSTSTVSYTHLYYNSGSVMYSAIGKGEAAISIAVLSDIIDNKENNKMPLEIVDAESGSVVITDCVAALKNAPHPNACLLYTSRCV